MTDKTDRDAYNHFYKNMLSSLSECRGRAEYLEAFQRRNLSPFYLGGSTKGGVRGLAVQRLIDCVERKNRRPEAITILDAGCGQGELSVWLAANGFKVYGVDISEEACRMAGELANIIGVQANVKFLPNSLEKIDLDDESVDFVIGHASLHHFIKYEGVSTELKRVLKAGGEMFFADSFGENPLYHLFHNKEEMQRLGDVILTRNKIHQFFGKDNLTVELIPYDWFAMLDKLFQKLLSNKCDAAVRKLSKCWWTLDRATPINNFTLWFAGSVMTHVAKPDMAALGSIGKAN